MFGKILHLDIILTLTGVLTGVLTASKKSENTGVQSLSTPPKNPTKSAKIFLATEPEIEDEVVDGYLPYGEEDLKFVRETLLTHCR